MGRDYSTFLPAGPAGGRWRCISVSDYWFSEMMWYKCSLPFYGKFTHKLHKETTMINLVPWISRPEFLCTGVYYPQCRERMTYSLFSQKKTMPLYNSY